MAGQRIHVKIIVTDIQLSRWNHIRHRAGLEDITKEQAERILSNASIQSRAEIYARIGH